MESLLIKKRVLKSNVTRALNEVEKKQLNRIQLELYESKCAKFEKESLDLFEKVYETCNPDESEKFMEEQNTVQDSIDQIWVLVKTELSKLNTDLNVVAKSENVSNKFDSLRLPKLNLPKFDGSIESWLSFRDLFIASIHKNASLSNSQRLSYLKLSLENQPAKILQSISINDANYEIAWSLLEERYSNKRDQVFAHLKKFMNIAPIQNESPHAILKLVDTANECIRSLEVLDQKIEGFSENLLAYILLQKLDSGCKLWFEREIEKDELPKISVLISFLKEHARKLSASNSNAPVNSKRYQQKTTSMVLGVNEKNTQSCKFCHHPHKLFKCQKFLKLSVKDRFEFVKKQNLCFLCFSVHSVRNCKSVNSSCKYCRRRHNSLLCFSNQHENSVELTAAPSSDETQPVQLLNADAIPFYSTNKQTECLIAPSVNSVRRACLPTAKVLIKNKYGNYIEALCLLDSASVINLCTSDLADALSVQQRKADVTISCLSGVTVLADSKINTAICNKDRSFCRELDFLVVPKITTLMPVLDFNTTKSIIPEDVELANPEFSYSEIQILLGIGVFFDLLKSDRIYIQNTDLILQDSVFGFLLSGCLESAVNQALVNCALIEENAEAELKKFFDLESIGIKDDPICSEKDQAIEIFNNTVCFKEGRYEVCLPWKRNWIELQDNFSVAEKRFKILLRKIRNDKNLFSQYSEIMNDYLYNGIIEKVLEPSKPIDKPVFYLPHRAVMREESVSTKCRVVFDGGSHEMGQMSLNDCLYTGVNLHPNIFHLLTYFRLNKIAILADIERAFLQISLSENDRDVVRFLFTEDDPSLTNNVKMQVYRFKRVIFGLNSSPFLLAATIKEHIKKYQDFDPKIFELLDKCMYFDDLVTGSDSTDTALEISRRAKDVMAEAAMNLRKWLSNDPELLKQWKEEKFELHPLVPDVAKDSMFKVLGMSWDIVKDRLSIETENLIKHIRSKKDTKRFILQTAGKIYDPLGLLSPFTIRLKCILQELWARKLPWDEQLPTDLCGKWSEWCKEVPQLLQVDVPRFVLSSPDSNSQLEIHCFADASQKAYGAAVYVRVITPDRISTNLLASKSRVAPLKKVTLPRLELLAMLIAARLGAEIKSVIDRKQQSSIQFWSDSKIALYWIKGPSTRWKTFVANRVREIQKLTEPDSWNHCAGRENIADLLTRGLAANSLVNSSRWWTGADFLKISELCDQNFVDQLNPDINQLSQRDREAYLSEAKCSQHSSDITTCVVSDCPNLIEKLLELSYSYNKIIHVLSFILRFIFNCRNSEKRAGPLSLEETKSAETLIVKESQKGLLHKKEFAGNILNLNPFLDSNQLIRVGGRLEKSCISYDQKHPIILPKSSKLCKIYFSNMHKKLFHVGPQGLLNAVRLKFWPLSGRDLARKTVHQCITCFKAKPNLCSQIMGELPSDRVRVSAPFSCTGLDLSGPHLVTYKHQRKGALNKIYICVCVCLATKAIHLELLSDLTADALIATLKRFMARRGKSLKIFTDNATNFIGADAKLKEFYRLFNFPDEKLISYFTTESIEWNYIPPRSPNFGGLWEAGVKSVKYHLKRVVGNQRFTYEEFETIVIQIEGILNSRPLTPLSNDLESYEVLTPGHFLIGRSIIALPEPALIDLNMNRLDRWQKTSRVVQTIWKRWKNEYLNTLQQRSKWMCQKENLTVGLMVLIKEDTLPVSKWLLGRIVSVYPGSDNKVRVVDLKISNGKILKRNIRDLAVLPIDHS